MAIYLVQHGKALSKEQDPERGLSEEGKADVQRIADTAKHYRVTVACIKHSGKKRARETAELFASALCPAEGVQQIAGINPLDNVAPIAEELNAVSNVMLVGHLPFMDSLAAYLITGNADKSVFKFQGGGIVCLDSFETGWAVKWALMPQVG